MYLARAFSRKGYGNVPRIIMSRNFHASTTSFAKVLISDNLDPSCAQILRQRGHEVVEDTSLAKDKESMLKAIGQYDGLIVRSATKVTAEVMAHASNLKFIGRAGTGVDNIDVNEATNRGILVMNTPGGNTFSAAELTFAMLLATCRNIPSACQSLKEGRWDRKKYQGAELNGKTIGIIGCGRIGREVARWCQAFGMNTLGFDALVAPDVMQEAGIKKATLEDIYAESDFITLHCPLNSDTKNLFNDETFAKCKDGVRIINCARGGIVNEADLLESLKSGKVAGAALDVFESEPPKEESHALLQHPNVICTPHLGASTEEGQLRVAQDIAKQFADAFDNTRLVGVVNAAHINMIANDSLRPYAALAERIGSMQSQLISGRAIKRISLEMQGPILKKTHGLVSAAFLTGFLRHLVSVPINLVNAPAVAKEDGIIVHEGWEASHGRFQNNVTVTCEYDNGKSRSISGTVFGKKLRLTSVDDFDVEFEPEGPMLFFQNQDKPGMLSAITAILLEHGINIANFSVGREKKGGNAVGVLQTDSAIPAEAIHKIKDLKGLVTATGVEVYGESIAEDDSTDSKPATRPASPDFGSGPCKKRPGYSLTELDTTALGRSHRSALGKDKLKKAINESKRLLGIPEDYYLGIVPASDTGAYEMAMWALLGERPVDICYWESFGKGWHSDITSQLKLQDVNTLSAPYGELPDLTKTNPDHDICFTWNGTTSGVKVPNGDWISDKREGLTLCDATSAVFAMDMPWNKLDVVTYSWQKVLGGEGAHGVIVLSPKAVARLERNSPQWPMPKIFRLTKSGKLNKPIFEGNVINTPSMLCVEDYLDALNWVDSIGGTEQLMKISQNNLGVIQKFVAENDWIHLLAKDPSTVSNTSVCLTIDLPDDKVKEMIKLLASQKVAYDIGAYRDAPAGLRIWCGATVETEDMKKLMPWLKWAYEKVKN